MRSELLEAKDAGFIEMKSYSEMLLLGIQFS